MTTKNTDLTLNMKRQFSDGTRYTFVIIALFVFSLIIYSNSFYGEWHLDDAGNILENTNIHLKELSWPEIKKTFYLQGRISRPVTLFSFAVNYYFGGLNVFGYHVVNLIVHYISAVFLFFFIYNTLRLTVVKDRYGANAYPIALVATILWAMHPVQVPAVTYIVQRMASMAGMFYIMAMYFYLKGRTSKDGRRGMVFFIICALSSLLSFGSKQNAAMLPVSLFIYDLFLIQGVTGDNIKKNIKIAILPFIICSALGIFYADVSSILNGYDNRPFTLVERLLTEPRVIVFYVSLLLYPINTRFALLHDIDVSRTLFDPWTTLPAILLIVLINGYAITAARKRPLISFCIIFFFLNHVIEGTFVPLELIYEHRNYIPSMVFFVPVAILIVRVLDYMSYRKYFQVLIALLVVFTIFIMGKTVYMRNEILRTDLSLWMDNVSKYQGLSVPHNNLGHVYFKKGRLLEAFAEFYKASQLNRYSNLRIASITQHNLGQIYRITGKDDRAIASFKNALLIYSDYTPSLYAMAIVEHKRGNTEAAYEHIIMALNIDPNDSKLHELLGVILLKRNKLGAAFAESRKALDLDSGRTIPISVIAEVYRKKGETEKAIQYWEMFLEKNPSKINAYLALIELYASSGKKGPLSEMIGRLLDLRGNENIMDFIPDSTEHAGLSVYIPDMERLLAIIKDNTQDINLKRTDKE